MSLSPEMLIIIKNWINNSVKASLTITPRETENGVEYVFTQGNVEIGVIANADGVPLRYTSETLEYDNMGTWEPVKLDNMIL